MKPITLQSYFVLQKVRNAKYLLSNESHHIFPL